MFPDAPILSLRSDAQLLDFPLHGRERLGRRGIEHELTGHAVEDAVRKDGEERAHLSLRELVQILQRFGLRKT